MIKIIKPNITIKISGNLVAMHYNHAIDMYVRRFSTSGGKGNQT